MAVDHLKADSTETLRVLLVSPHPPPTGGIARGTTLLLQWLETEAGVAVHTVDISPRWRSVVDVRMWKRVFGGGLQGLRDGWRCLSAWVTFRPHVLHLNTAGQLRGPWDTTMIALARLVSLRSVYFIHMGRLSEIVQGGGLEWWGMRWAIRLADRVVGLDAASEAVLQRLLPPGRAVRLPNAIPAPLPPRGIAPVSQDGPTVLYLGHILPTKGMNELVTAWRELKPRGWRLRLAGAGSTNYQDELLQMAGPGVDITFLGDLPPEGASLEMLAADIFVLPSHTEGFPNALLEAMAAGKASVSTSVGAISEMLDTDGDERCGIVVQPRDAHALATALGELMSNPQLRETLARRARAKVERCYTTDRVFPRLLELWRRLARRAATKDVSGHAVEEI